jgi:hypothetical protein
VLLVVGGLCGVVAKQAERIGQLELVVKNGTLFSASKGSRSSDRGGPQGRHRFVWHA